MDLTAFDLKGKVALVTGGAHGIGFSIAEGMAKCGATVCFNCSNEGSLEKGLAAYKAVGIDAHGYVADVTDEAAVNAMIAQIKAEVGPVDILVNNAGIRDDVLMMWMEPQQWHSVIGTSLDGFYNVTRPLLKGMLVNRFGRIVNIVSLSGIKGLPGQANYAAAKGGVIAATKALAQEVAKKGVTVNAIAPGFVRTDMTADIDEAELRKQIPAGRFCEPAEVADLAMFLISEQASYITGEVISINGGLYT
ncbi:3-oxoacyl-ACP reductase FabG [Alistipes sp.]|uniref:3-oxoacyl-ACP reductase FabG n=1 Tax=Alistipes sp. TaxID=1872444 RepID=UPI0023F192A1|nr:3-oxoacyl-ACP reductase FabG [Alistipes sp.]